MSTIVPDDNTPVVRFIPMPVCEHCGGPVREQRCDPIDITEPWDRMRTMVPGPTYNLPCGCIIRPGRGRLTVTDRTPSGEHTSADTDDVVARIDSAVEDWEELDGARWSPDGSHEHDPEPWTRRDMGVQQGQADWGCDDVAEQMSPPTFTWTFRDHRPGSLACFPWDGAAIRYRLRDAEGIQSPWGSREADCPRRDLADRITHAIVTIDRWRRRIGR